MAERVVQTVRLEAAQVERVDAIVEALSVRAGGVDVSRSAALRVIIEKGIEAVEKENGLIQHPSLASIKRAGT